MPLAVDVDGRRAERGQQRHPEHDRAVQPAPVRGELVEHRLDRVRIALDVADRVVADDEGVDDDRRRHAHDGREQVEGADAALDQRTRAAARAGDRDRRGVGTDDERGQQQVIPERGHAATLRPKAWVSWTAPPGPRGPRRTSTGTWRSFPWRG